MMHAQLQDLRRPLRSPIPQSRGVLSKIVLVNAGVLANFKPELEEEVSKDEFNW